MSDEQTHVILHDGQELLRGGEITMRIVFRNLTGKQDLPGQTYLDYMQLMCKFTKTPINPDKLELKPVEEDDGEKATKAV